MPRPADKRTPIEMLVEVEQIVQGLRQALAGSPSLMEINMSLSMAEELNKMTARLVRRLNKDLRQRIYKESEGRKDDTEGYRKRPVKINIKRN